MTQPTSDPRTVPGTGDGGWLAGVGRIARLVLATEARMWVSLYRWIRRSPVGEPGAVPFGYARAVTPIIAAFIAVSAIEIPVLGLVLPWVTVAVIADVIGVYGLIWMFGLLASVRVYPHLVAESGLRVRANGGVDVTIPWSYVASIQANNRGMKGREQQIDHTGGAAILCLGVFKQTHLDIAFRHPTILELPKGDSEPLNGIRIAADEPSALVDLARQHITTATAQRRLETPSVTYGQDSPPRYL